MSTKRTTPGVETTMVGAEFGSEKAELGSLFENIDLNLRRATDDRLGALHAEMDDSVIHMDNLAHDATFDAAHDVVSSAPTEAHAFGSHDHHVIANLMHEFSHRPTTLTVGASVQFCPPDAHTMALRDTKRSHKQKSSMHPGSMRIKLGQKSVRKNRGLVITDQRLGCAGSEYVKASATRQYRLLAVKVKWYRGSNTAMVVSVPRSLHANAAVSGHYGGHEVHDILNSNGMRVIPPAGAQEVVKDHMFLYHDTEYWQEIKERAKNAVTKGTHGSAFGEHRLKLNALDGRVEKVRASMVHTRQALAYAKQQLSLVQEHPRRRKVRYISIRANSEQAQTFVAKYDRYVLKCEQNVANWGTEDDMRRIKKLLAIDKQNSSQKVYAIPVFGLDRAVKYWDYKVDLALTKYASLFTNALASHRSPIGVVPASKGICGTLHELMQLEVIPARAVHLGAHKHSHGAEAYADVWRPPVTSLVHSPVQIPLEIGLQYTFVLHDASTDEEDIDQADTERNDDDDDDRQSQDPDDDGYDDQERDFDEDVSELDATNGEEEEEDDDDDGGGEEEEAQRRPRNRIQLDTDRLLNL